MVQLEFVGGYDGQPFGVVADRKLNPSLKTKIAMIHALSKASNFGETSGILFSSSSPENFNESNLYSFILLLRLLFFRTHVGSYVMLVDSVNNDSKNKLFAS